MSCSRFPECTGARTELGEVLSNEPTTIGTHPDGGEIYLMNGRFGHYVQLGEAKKGSKAKPRRASIPKEKDPASVTVDEAVTYLSLPRELGAHPETGKMISASIGRFGPFVVHEKDFRSLKTDDVYKITLERALEIFKEEKKRRGFRKKEKE